MLLKQAAGLVKGAGTTGREKVGSVTKAQVEEIARLKLGDLNAKDLAGAISTISGTARSMGLDIN